MSKFQDLSTVNEKLQSNTQLTVNTTVFNWSLSNFSLVSRFLKETICSNEFMIDDTPYELHVRAAGCELDFITINLFKVTKDKNCLFIQQKISVLNDEGEPIATREDEAVLDDKERSGPEAMFCTNDVILLNDMLRIRCEVVRLSQVSKDSIDLPDEKIPKIQSACDTIEDKLLCSKQPEKDPEFLPRMVFVLLVLLLPACFILDIKDNKIAYTPYQKEVINLVYNTTLKVINIAEALNLTEVKLISSEFIHSFAKLYNV